jgi:hypothetical protein
VTRVRWVGTTIVAGVDAGRRCTGLCGLVLITTVCACGGARETPAWRAQVSPSLGDEPLRGVDDAPFSPAPTSRRERRPDSVPPGAEALRLEPDHAQARETALSFVAALLDADAQAMSLLLDDQVTLIAEGARKLRRDVVTTCLGERNGLVYRHERTLEALVDLSAVAVTAASVEGLPRPLGTNPTDLAVQFSPAPGVATSGPRPPCLGTLYVRPGPRSVVVAVMR